MTDRRRSSSYDPPIPQFRNPLEQSSEKISGSLRVLLPKMSKPTKCWAELRGNSLLLFKSRGAPTAETLLSLNTSMQVIDLGFRNGTYVISLSNAGQESLYSLLFKAEADHAAWLASLSEFSPLFQADLQFCYALEDPPVDCKLDVTRSALAITFQATQRAAALTFSLADVGLRSLSLLSHMGLSWLRIEVKSQEIFLGSSNFLVLKNLKILLEERLAEPAPSAGGPQLPQSPSFSSSALRTLSDGSQSALALGPSPEQSSRLRFFKLRSSKIGKNIKTADWLKVYIAVEGGTLTYFKRVHSRTPAGAIALDAIAECTPLPVWVNSLTRTSKHPLLIKGGEKDFVFAWKTQEEQAHWAKVFTAHLAPKEEAPPSNALDTSRQDPAVDASVDRELAIYDEKLRKILSIVIPNLLLIVISLIIFIF